MHSSLPLAVGGNRGRPHVLLVDDEPQLLVALQDELSDDFEVSATGRPEDALRLAAEDSTISVVISDQRMPGMTGDELFARLRHCSSASRILCTAFADLPAVVRSINEGRIFGYTAKPWDSAELRMKVQSAADHHRLTEELWHEKQLFGQLMTSMPDAIFFLDAEQRYVRVNPAALELLGAADMTAVVGKRLSELVPTDTTAQIEAIEQQIFADGHSRRDVMEHQTRDGDRRWLSTTRALMHAPDGKILGLIGIAQDISDSAHMQEALRAGEERPTRMLAQQKSRPD